MKKENKGENAVVSTEKKIDNSMLMNIKIMEMTTLFRPTGWIEWDTWTGADSPDCDSES